MQNFTWERLLFTLMMNQPLQFPSNRKNVTLTIFNTYVLFYDCSILPMPCLEVCPSVIDFGNLVCEHQITSQQLVLTNSGSKHGNFMFLVDQLPSCFKVSPIKVTLSPGEAVHVKVTSMSWGQGYCVCMHWYHLYPEARGILNAFDAL